MKNIKFISTSFLCLLLISCNTLIKTTTKQGTYPPHKEIEEISSVNIELRDYLLRGANFSKLKLDVFGKTINIIKEHTDTINGGLLWYGKIENEPGSSVVFSEYKGVFSGNIHNQKGQLFEIRYRGGGVYQLREIDVSKFREEAEPTSPRINNQPPNPFADGCPNTDAATDIDVLVVYTAAARMGAGSTEAMISEVYLACYETNLIYMNSDIMQRIRLVHVEEVNYTESGSSQTDRDRLQNPSDGFMDNVPILRDKYAADLVVLIAETSEANNCGISYIMETVNTNFEPFAYAFVRRSCATGYYSFGHELGHIMGARHDCTIDGTLTPFVFSHGFHNITPTPIGTGPWRTVMSKDPLTAQRVPYFSNPTITFPAGVANGDPMGNNTGSCQADNHSVLNNTALTVANFRCSTTDVNNVWMKDTWNDTGHEPDPNTASEDMWASPYIWIRNTRDNTFLHQHQHENPINNTTNWAYIKLHNGGNNSLSGNLELYYANASVSLVWPSGWTLIKSISKTMNPSSTAILETDWSNIPGEGHFCLLARWVCAADPMTSIEGSNIEANVRGNNNIIWRNVNVVSAGDAADVIERFNCQRLSGSSIIKIVFDNKYPHRIFSQEGIVKFKFDDTTTNLLKNWEYGKQMFKKEGDYYLMPPQQTVVLKNFPIDIHNAQLYMVFRKKKETYRQTYFVSVKHSKLITRATKESNAVVVAEDKIGGVDYEIRLK